MLNQFVRQESGATGGEKNCPKNEASPWLRKEVNLRQALALLRGGFVLGWQRFVTEKPMVSRQGGFICAFFYLDLT